MGKKEDIDLRKATWSDVQRLSEDDFNYFKQCIKDEEERRTEPEFETVEAFYFDDGCEGCYFDIDDFQECARHKRYENDWDLIDSIERDLHQAGSVTISKGKYTKEYVGRDFFFGKDNPYEKFYNDED